MIEYADLAAFVHYRSLVKTITPEIGKSNDDPLESAGIARFLGVEHVVANLAGPTSIFRSHTSRCHQPWSGPNAKRNSLRVGRLAFRIASVHRYTCAWIQGVMLSGTVYPVDHRKHWGAGILPAFGRRLEACPPTAVFLQQPMRGLVLHRRGFIAYFEIGIREEIGVSRHAAARHPEPMKKRVGLRMNAWPSCYFQFSEQFVFHWTLENALTPILPDTDSPSGGAGSRVRVGGRDRGSGPAPGGGGGAGREAVPVAERRTGNVWQGVPDDGVWPSHPRFNRPSRLPEVKMLRLVPRHLLDGLTRWPT